LGVYLRAALAVCVGLAAAPTPAAADRVDELVQRLEQQQAEIQALRQEVQDLREQVPPPPQHPEYRKEDGEEVLTEYVNPRIRLDIAAQINQAFNYANDGDSTKGYFVDNDSSNSRVRFAGVSTWEEGPDVGATLEIAFSGNNSFDVSQDDRSPGDFLQVRRADVWAMDERYGRIMFGRGSMAADNTAEFDLSLVGGPIMLSGVAFPFGGLQFTDGNDLTGVTIGEAFFNFDGFRQNRIRYDSPMLGPAQLSLSAGADGRYDAAITFGGDYDHWTGIQLGGEAFTTLGAVSIHNPNEGGVDYRMAGSWSILHNDSGVSLTLSSGFDSGSDGGTPYNAYAKLGWDTEIVRFGPTGFGIDYTWTENVSGVGDEGQSFGIAAVQVLDRFGIELYTQARWLNLDRGLGSDFDNVFVVTTGTRVRF
jgi:hypothetical protein